MPYFSGGKAFEVCGDCGKLVTLNKWLLGSLHVCLSPEERVARAQALHQLGQQQAAIRDPMRGTATGNVLDLLR